MAHHHLGPSEVELALTLAHARPIPADTSRFLIRALLLAGVLSLAAGLVFFVAANWNALRVTGRFALLEGLFIGSIAVALWRPPPFATGRYALLAGFITIGALLALFGQTYQTGANLYELFLSWALLGLPLIIAGQWSVLWAAWVLVLNVALALFCGWRPEGGLLGVVWVLFSSSARSISTLPLLAAVVNLVLWASSEWVQTRRGGALAPQMLPDWLRRFIIACALAFATWAGSLVVLGTDVGLTDYQAGGDVWTLVWLALMLTGVAAYTVWRRADVFPLASIAACVIVLGMLAIARYGPFQEMEGFLALALWLIASSTVSGRVLMNLVRAWRRATAET